MDMYHMGTPDILHIFAAIVIIIIIIIAIIIIN